MTSGRRERHVEHTHPYVRTSQSDRLLTLLFLSSCDRGQRKSLEAYRKIYAGRTNYLRISRLVIDVIVQRIGHRQT